MDIKILYEDKNYILAEKPAGMPSQADKTGDDDLLTILSEEKGIKDLKIINRLDRPVGGIIIFAKNKKSVAFCSKLVQSSAISKVYTAVICGVPEKNEGTFEDMLIKDSRTNTSKVAAKGDKNAKKAILYYNVLKTVESEEFGKLSLIEVKLETGRHHQIRVQFASRNLPLWGDGKYNSAFQKGRRNFNIALWSSRTSFYDELSKKTIEAESKPQGEIFNIFIW